jgi:hypothetical protein
MKVLLPATLLALATISVASVALRVGRNKARWIRNGFYGFPTEVVAVDATGTPETIVLTDSARQPLPSAVSQWRYAVSEIATDLLKQFIP